MSEEFPVWLVTFTFWYFSPGYSDALAGGWGFNLQYR